MVYDFTGRESTGQFLRMLNEALDAEIKKLGEDEVSRKSSKLLLISNSYYCSVEVMECVGFPAWI